MADPFPEDVKRFVVEHIDSVEQLEVLLLLRADPSREWDAAAVSHALCTSPESVAKRLAGLRTRGLLAGGEGDGGRYRYGPATAEHDRLAGALAEAYRERRVAVITLIYSKPADQVQAFADAFKLRKEE
jgi:hypothetical protein